MEQAQENSAPRQALLTGLFASENEKALEPYFQCNIEQRKFIDHLLADPKMVAYKAYMRAYGVNAGTARRNASRLLTNADIQAAIQARADQLAEQAEIKIEALLLELANIAHSDIADIVDLKDGTLTVYNLDELPPGASRLISEISREPSKFGDKIKVKLYSKEKALEMLGRYKGMFKDVQEVRQNTLEDALNRIAEKRKARADGDDSSN
ncbi:MAG: terminase small subunit [Desulfarculaceae bacterium]|nr:terminase small subunit [Desulfarculaceae bacterium]MCF8073283.1 terminase small subunit [Desulfarculaceae bacterium]MCF8100879.1 terminase small subunit [Desulfarculaceae bacterium]MCF8116665.1 terminase small subunit [Desulfarculaceae bacterium]